AGDGEEFELPTADRAEFRIGRNQHPGPGLAGGGAFGFGHLDEDGMGVTVEEGAEVAGGYAHAVYPDATSAHPSSDLRFAPATFSLKGRRVARGSVWVRYAE